jgi:L-ribulose-5-phosphate 4-epimerase
MSGIETLKREVCEANLELVRAGLVRLTWGNVSGVDRAAGCLVIKPSGVPYAGMRPEHMVVVRLDDGAVVEGNLRPSSDTPTHLVLYRAFPAIGGIVHTHSPAATAWAQAEREIPCLGTTHADVFHGAVPLTRAVTELEVARDYEGHTGKVIVERFSSLDPVAVPGVLVKQHGPFTWGPDPAHAVENAVSLEALADMAARTLTLNPDTPRLPAYLLEKHYQRKHGSGAYYGQGSPAADGGRTSA